MLRAYPWLRLCSVLVIGFPAGVIAVRMALRATGSPDVFESLALGGVSFYLWRRYDLAVQDWVRFTRPR